jgi:hypothetical protein
MTPAMLTAIGLTLAQIGRCGCVGPCRTLVELDAVAKLDDFGRVRFPR